jgi:Zn-finger nucleic acid-binding protein
LCDPKELERRAALDIELEVCPKCRGIWFSAGKLESFPDRPSVARLLPRARQAPGRCRKKGHPVPASMKGCPQCGASAAQCPDCQQRLSTVALSKCSIEICTGCQGAWLDAGELALLEGAGTTGAAVTATSKPRGSQWEIPASTDVAGGVDPYRAAGQTQALTNGPKNVFGLVCKHCDAQLEGNEAFAYEGDIFCVNCRPEDAVAGADADTFVDKLERWILAIRPRNF